jgi:hypothetical protein
MMEENVGAAEPPSVTTTVIVSMPEAPEGVPESRVIWKFEEREYTDVPCAICFVLSVLFFFAIFFAMIGTSNFMYTEAGGIASAYLDQARECCNSASNTYSQSSVCTRMVDDLDWSPTRRSGDAADFEAAMRRSSRDRLPASVWQGFEFRPECPITLFVALAVICIGWLYALKICTTTVLMIPVACEFVLLILVGIWFFTESAAEAGVVMILLALALAGVTYWQRDNILKAAITISSAVTQIFANPGLWIFVFGWIFAQVFLVLVILVAAIMLGGVQEVSSWTDDDTSRVCEFRQQSWAGTCFQIGCLIWLWMWYFVRSVQTYVIAGVIGSSHFHVEGQERPTNCQFLALAFSKSLGTLGVISGIVAIVDYIIRQVADKSCAGWCCDIITCFWPLTLILYIIYCCFKTTLDLLTKVTLVYHTFTSKNFSESMHGVFGLLQDRVGHAMALQLTAQNMFDFLGYGFALAFAFCTWFWLGNEYGENVLVNNSSSLGENWITLFKILLIIGLFFMMLKPYIALIIVVALGILIGENMPLWLIPWFCAIFVGGICCIFFETMGQVVIASSDTMLVAMTIDEKTLSADEFAKRCEEQPFMALMVTEMHNLEKKDEVVQPMPAPQPGVAVEPAQPPAYPPAAPPPPPPPPAPATA